MVLAYSFHHHPLIIIVINRLSADHAISPAQGDWPPGPLVQHHPPDLIIYHAVAVAVAVAGHTGKQSCREGLMRIHACRKGNRQSGQQPCCTVQPSLDRFRHSHTLQITDGPLCCRPPAALLGLQQPGSTLGMADGCSALSGDDAPHPLTPPWHAAAGAAGAAAGGDAKESPTAPPGQQHCPEEVCARGWQLVPKLPCSGSMLV